MSNSDMTKSILFLWGALCGLPIIAYVIAVVVFDFEVTLDNVLALTALISFFTFLIVWAARRQKAVWDRAEAERQRQEAAVVARIAEEERLETRECLETV